MASLHSYYSEGIVGNFSDQLKHSAPEADQHLLALAAFAKRDSIPSDVSTLSNLSQDAIPLISRFLDGEKTTEIRNELKMVLPAIAQCLKGIASEIDGVRLTKAFSNDGAPWNIRALLHAGAHIEAAIWGLSPDSPEAIAEMQEGKRWDDVLDRNLKQGKLVLEEAANIKVIWRQAQVESGQGI
jgi:hypothetical protein